MSKKQLIARGFALVLAVSMLGGCSSQSEINELNNMKALNSDSQVKSNYKLSWTDEQTMIYQQVADRTLLDLSTLAPCSEDELQQVTNYMDSVDNQLIGQASSEFGYIDTCFTNYLLSEFERTPNYWQRSQTVVRGVDPDSRSVVVDVTYKTIGFAKDVRPSSGIVLGEPDYQKKLEVRHDHWMSYLEQKYNGYQDALLLEESYNRFVSAYGDPEDIIESQNNITLTDRIYETGNQITYEGVVDTALEQGSATMVVRYVLVPNYVLGINLGMTCDHMYVIDYQIDNDTTEGMALFTDEGYATVTDSVYSLVYSYFQCLDENDYAGLYSLTSDFGKLDKYYQDMFATTYLKHSNFAISLFSINGTHITCGVEIASKVRPKGSNMTFPSYNDRYYMDIELVDGTLKVQNMVLLSRKLEGEPAISTDDADMSGFNALIDLTNEDRQSIETLIANFGALQLLGDTTSDDFANVVDISISESDLNVLKASMTQFTGVTKATWLQNYQQGTSNYASVKCREMYQSASNGIVEANVVYDFIYKGGRWYVYKYTVNSSVKLDSTTMNTTGVLCLVSPGKVEAMYSQIKGTESTSSQDISDTSKSFTHEVYTPVLKSGSSEQGLSTEEGFNLPDDERDRVLDALITTAGLNMTTDEIWTKVDAGDDVFRKWKEENPDIHWSEDRNMRTTIVAYVGISYNIANNRYQNKGLLNSQLKEYGQSLELLIKAWTENGDKITSPQEKKDVSDALDILKNLNSTLERTTN